MQRRPLISSVRRGGTVLIKAASLVILATYFALALLYLAPMNPLKPTMQGTLMRTVGHYMAQNWSLFAPNPASQNLVLEAVYLSRDQRRQLARHGLQSMEDVVWIDLTSPLIHEFHRNRLSGSDRFSRPADSAMRQALAGGVDLLPWSRACRGGDTASCLVLEDQAQLYRQAGISSLRTIASAACLDLHDDCSRRTHVALRVRTELPVPWSRRHSDDARETTSETLGVFPIQRGLAQPGLFGVSPDGGAS